MIHRFLLIFALSVGFHSASALNFMLDYSLDTYGFAGQGGGASQSAIDQAAADIGTLITSSLTEVNQSDFIDGGNTVTVTTQYTPPTTNATIDYDPVANPIAANTVIVYVGARSLTGTTLAQGGPAGAALSGKGSSYGAAATLADTHMARGGGPEIGRISDFGGSGVDIKLGSSIGNLWFDVNTDNDGSIDSDAELASFWHFDHTTAPAAGKIDLYTVALHEILHSIGVGTSNSWDNQRSGTTWNGANAIAANGGSGVGLVDILPPVSPVNDCRMVLLRMR
ncbi:MAG: hypothetical protein ACI9R3_003614 [Verrucomicrobiales bacterium]|jgi:hypothetical protein